MDLLELQDLADLAQALRPRVVSVPERLVAFFGEGGGGGGEPQPAPPPLLSSSQISPPEVEGPSVTYAEGGRSVRIQIPAGPMDPDRPRGKRRPISEFTTRSRAALLHAIQSIDERQVPAAHLRFVTLTYPAAFPAASASKRDLDTLLKRFEREWGPRALFWKLEPQKRGAPHFHLLILMGSPVALQDELEWWARSWHEIAGGGDRWHLKWHLGRLGNRPCVEQVHDWNGARNYAGKYMGKLPEESATWHEPGRFWGMRRRDMFPRSIKRIEVGPLTARLLRRAVVRWFEKQPTGRWWLRNCSEDERGRLVGHGKIVRMRLKPSEVVEYQGLMLMRPYHRRWPTSKGGCRVFMPSTLIEQLLTWATREAESRAPF